MRKPRNTVIHDLRVVGVAAAQTCEHGPAHGASLSVECEAGTYVRVLCEELGGRLGLPARMGALLRIGAGPFVLEECVRPDQIAADPQRVSHRSARGAAQPETSRWMTKTRGGSRTVTRSACGTGSQASREREPER